ncbi:NADH:flavin oxidoreductase/NADH oxidase family protein [Caulobacter hibisci]|uniref:NADH:flavin oxidoreductase/NADH oxidase family protein n=1 Tax=Caulobacter hibisci TaxID=2035993 RepID=A0ABS0SZL9_9CAUL|nr:NADH:flavin oxidoreductase/NADH oxidase family protein [Caulobacter hibisci]MBI1684103.1 NADH:flavin oxidoreductase/NADH oxidase family protein [Caulobacter hibisci]
MTQLFDTLPLPCGQTLPNRIAKAAMEENLAQPDRTPGPALWSLYRRWAEGGAGLLLTGNVMVDGRALTGPGGTVLEADTDLAGFLAWAKTAKAGGAKVWMQINHPGRQVFEDMGGVSWSASDVPLDLGEHSKLFAKPVAMSQAQIDEVIARFADTARQAERAGFDGVQVHAAHGYLLSQFLSPLSNRRTDRWGGPLENRARLLMEIVRSVRAAVRPGFAVSVKLNSSDFQKGGFSANEARTVVEWLNAEAVDLVELSGGSYESPAMRGSPSEGTLRREAYFMEFAAEMVAVAKMPLMTTGGVRRRSIAQNVLDSGVAVVGVATALAIEPSLPALWRTGDHDVAPPPRLKTKNSGLASMAGQAFVVRQLVRMSRGRSPKPTASPLVSLIQNQIRRRKLTRTYRTWLGRRTAA